MSTENTFKDTRLLEALEYLDKKYIAEVFDDLKVPDMSEYVPGKRTPRKIWKQFAALAACLILLSLAVPAFNKVVEVVSSFAAGWGSGTTEERSDIFEDEQAKGTTTEQQYIYGAYLKPIKNLEPLPQGLLEEIDSKSEVGFSSFAVLNKGNQMSDRYLGYIGGYYVFFETSAGDRPGYFTATAFGELHVAGYDFYYNTPFSIILHKDGVNITLKKAYESGLITLDDVRTIYCRNNEYLRYFNSELKFKDKVPITEDEFNEICNAWIAKFSENEHLPKEFDWIYGLEYYCYGHVGENILFHAWNPDYEGTNGEISFEIEGYMFSEFSLAVNIWVYHNGEIMQLRDAYNNGLVASEDLPTISYMNQCVFGNLLW